MVRTLMILSVALATCHGFAVVPRAHGVTSISLQSQLSRRSTAAGIASVRLCEPAGEASEGFGAWFKKALKFDRDTLAKSGVDAFFTYGVVSNLNAAITLSLAWATFSRASGLSPLAAGQWKKFLAVYVGVYATFGTVTRPFRFAAAISLTPIYSRLIMRVRGKLPFRDSNPKLNRTLALVIISLFGNVTGTCLIFGLGIVIAGFVTGVPPFPPGWSFAAAKAPAAAFIAA